MGALSVRLVAVLAVGAAAAGWASASVSAEEAEAPGPGTTAAGLEDAGHGTSAFPGAVHEEVDGLGEEGTGGHEALEHDEGHALGEGGGAAHSHGGGAAGAQQSPAGLDDAVKAYFAPVGDDAPRATEVPAQLGNLVRLAQTIAGEGEDQGTSEAPWAGLEDTFDRGGYGPMWEQVSGGYVGSACGAVSGQALCFDGEGSRVAVSAPVNAIGGGIVRFSLFMAFEDGVPADLVLEYKPVGRAWHMMERYSEESYANPGPLNPNQASLGSWDASEHDGFVTYAVRIPETAQSPATKFRWRQMREQVSGRASTWALDDVSVDAGAEAPAVQLSLPSGKSKQNSQLLTVVVQFSVPVDGFEEMDIQVENGTVVGLTPYNAKITGAGALYTALIKPEKPAGEHGHEWRGPFEVHVRVPPGACYDREYRANLGSNTVAVRTNLDKRRRRSHAELSFGPRPGPADKRWGAIVAEQDAALWESSLKPLQEGEKVDQDALWNQTAQAFANVEAIDEKLQEATAVLDRFLANPQMRPPQALLEKLEKEVEQLREAKTRLVQLNKLEAVEGLGGHVHDHEEEWDEFDEAVHVELEREVQESIRIHKELESEMDILRHQAEEVTAAMAEQKELRAELQKEREAIKAELAELSREHDNHFHHGEHVHDGLGHDHGQDGHHDHEHGGDMAGGYSGLDGVSHGDHEHGDAVQHNDHFHAHLDPAELAKVLHDLYGLDPKTEAHSEHKKVELEHEREEIEKDLAEERKLLLARRRMREEMDKDREEMSKEFDRLEEEKQKQRDALEREREALARERAEVEAQRRSEEEREELFRREVEAERTQREQFEQKQRDLLDDFAKQAPPAPAAGHTGAHASLEHLDKAEVIEVVKELYGMEPKSQDEIARHHAANELHQEVEAMHAEREELEADLQEQRRILYHKRRLREEMSEEKDELDRERARLDEERRLAREEAARERAEREAFMTEQRRMLDELMLQQRALRDALSMGLPRPDMSPLSPPEQTPAEDDNGTSRAASSSGAPASSAAGGSAAAAEGSPA